MYWIIGICAVVVFNVLVFMFIYGAGKANKKYDEQTEKFSENQKKKTPGSVGRIPGA